LTDGKTAVASASWRMLEAIGVGERAGRPWVPDPRDPSQRRPAPCGVQFDAGPGEPGLEYPLGISSRTA
jgi:hypothetical protein